jgi:hypothetical protein
MHTERQPAQPGLPVLDPADWRASDLDANRRWVFELERRDRDDLLKAAASVRRVIGDDPNALLGVPAERFCFGAFEEKFRALRSELEDGLGIALLRGLPLADMDPLDAAAIYWGIGRHLGEACSNNPEGDMLGHVTDLGKTQKDPRSRGYQTREEMDYHCDQSTVVGLLCVRSAQSGGISKVASSVALYNEMLRRSPQSVRALMTPFCWTKHGEMNEGERGYYESPVFNFIGGRLCTAFGPTHIRKGHALPGAPAMADEQREALALAEAIAEEQHHAMALEPGDMQFLNNLVTVHTRTEYTDSPDPAKKRLLWRLWLINPQIRPLTPYIRQWADGVRLHSTVARIAL